MILLNIFLVALLIGLPTAATVALLRMDRPNRTGRTPQVTELRRREWDRAA